METEMQEIQTSALSQIVKSEIDVQISTAKQYPRSIQKFRQDALSMATSDAETAASCFYKLKRGDSYIEGASVRLAEICASAWGNVRYGARIVDDNGKEVTAQGVCHDLEKNVSTTIDVTRRVTNKYGKRYSDDMVQVTKNAACSIALRNAIYKTVPFTFVKQIYDKAKLAAVGDAKTMGEKKQGMLQAFKQMRVSEDQILEFVEKRSMEDVGQAEIETMLGVFNAIKDGDTTIDEQFGDKKQKVADPFKKTDEPKEQNESAVKNAKASAGHIATIKKIVKSLKIDYPILDQYLEEYGVSKIEDVTQDQAQYILTELAKKVDEVDK